MPKAWLWSKELVRLESLSNYRTADGILATWCPQCKAIAPEVDKMAEEFAGKGVSFYQYDVDAN